MVITSRARLLVVCAMLTLSPVDGELAADPQIKPPIRGLVSMGRSHLSRLRQRFKV
jgi:hypothetical protein